MGLSLGCPFENSFLLHSPPPFFPYFILEYASRFPSGLGLRALLARERFNALIDGSSRNDAIFLITTSFSGAICFDGLA